MNQEPTEWSRDTFDRIAECANRDPKIPAWAYDIIGRFPLHPTIDKLLSKFAPDDWRLVLQQWPRVSMKDPARLAYTPSEQYAARNRVMVTSPGKYAAKHWSRIPAHELRDLTLLTTTESSMYFVHTIPEMIIGVEYGPPSCMASSSPWCDHHFRHEHDGFARLADWVLDKNSPEPDWELHPYASYRPENGWHMALRKEDGLIVARALCLMFNGGKYFVRSYRNGETEGVSPTCETLNAWLKEQNYKFVDDWPLGAVLDIGQELDRAPYLDGEDQRVEHCGNGRCEVNGSGDWLFQNTDGSYDDSPEDEDDEDYSTCDYCGNRSYSDDMTWVGRHTDVLVCAYCLRIEYAHVKGTGDFMYFVEKDQAATVLGANYEVDTENLPEDVMWVESADAYCLKDDVVDVDGEDYHVTDETICICQDTNTWCFREDSWYDDHSGLWYSNDEPYVEQPDGSRLHQRSVAELRNINQLVLL